MADYLVTYTGGDEYAVTVVVATSMPWSFDSFASRSEAATWLATNVVSTGRAYFIGSLMFLGLLGSTEISDLPGLVPGGDRITPGQYATISTATSAQSRTALLAADAWVLASPGTTLVVDEDTPISAYTSLRSRNIEVTGSFVIPADFTPVAGEPCIRLGEDSATLNGGRLKASLFMNGQAYFGKAKATWSPSGGSFPSGSTADDGYKALDSGTINGVAFVEGDIVKSLVNSASTSVYAGNWLKVPTGHVATNWSPAGGTFPAGSTSGQVYKATDTGVVDSIPFRTGDYIKASLANASTTTWAANWARTYNGIPAVRLEGVARGFADVQIEGHYCDILGHLRGNTEKLEVSISGYFCHGAYFENSFEDGTGGASSLDNVHVTIRGSSCGWWSWCEGTSVTEIYCLFQNQLSNYAVPAQRDYATRVRTYSGVNRTSRHDPAMLINQRTAPENSGVNFNDFEFANPTGQAFKAEATATGVTATARGGNCLMGQVRIATGGGGFSIEQDKGSRLSVVSQNQTAGIVATLGSTAKAATSLHSSYDITVEGAPGATGSVHFDNANSAHVNYNGTALPVTATTVARSSIVLPVGFIAGAVAYPAVAGLAVEFPAARKAFTVTASGDGAAVTFNLGGGGTGGNSYVRPSYIVVPGNTYTAGLNFAVIAPDSDGNARVTFTAAPAVGVNNLAFGVLIS